LLRGLFSFLKVGQQEYQFYVVGRVAIFVIVCDRIEFSTALPMSSSLSLIAQTAAVMRALALLTTLWLVSPAQAADIYASQLLGTTRRAGQRAAVALGTTIARSRSFVDWQNRRSEPFFSPVLDWTMLTVGLSQMLADPQGGLGWAPGRNCS
jgi:hypothetical protein